MHPDCPRKDLMHSLTRMKHMWLALPVEDTTLCLDSLDNLEFAWRSNHISEIVLVELFL